MTESKAPEVIGSRLGLLLAVAPPVAIWCWVLLSTSDLAVGPWATIGAGSACMVAIWLARGPVAMYRGTAGAAVAHVPDGLIQFTPGYLRFHASRAGWPVSTVLVAVLGLIALLGAGWLVLVLGVFW